MKPVTEEQRIEAIEKFLVHAISITEPGDPIIDGQHVSPSDRAVPYVEAVWREALNDDWAAFVWDLDWLYERLELVWDGGLLWRAQDLGWDE